VNDARMPLYAIYIQPKCGAFQGIRHVCRNKKA
jgi:hypothetical protein